MPRYRWRAVSIVMAASIVAGTSTTVAQIEPPDLVEEAAVPVHGTSTLVGQAEPGTTSVEGGIVRIRDTVLLTVEAASDPRVSGAGTITVNIDAYPDANGRLGAAHVRFGQMELRNDSGAWRGTFSGTLANGGFVQTYWLAGEGAYEGLSYVVMAGGNGDTWATQGLIFPGRIPPMGRGDQLPLDAIDDDGPVVARPSG